jgi:hypothetical protein
MDGSGADPVPDSSRAKDSGNSSPGLGAPCLELLIERGLEINHMTVWRWVQRYAPELEERTRPHLKPANKSWRVDETYVRVKGRWF